MKEKLLLETKVDKLVGCEESKQIEKLQAIGDMLLTDYIIKIGSHIIEPLWVEAYYYNAEDGFIDESVHKNDAQQDNFGQLYFHHKTGDQRSGVDLCLSRGKYYLSYLLKYMMVDGYFTTQSQLHEIIHDEYDSKSQILFSQVRPSKIICHVGRINIPESAGKYQKEKLASVRDINKCFINAKGKTQSLPNKMAILKEYIEEVYQAEERESETDKIKISKELVGEYWKDLFNV